MGSTRDNEKFLKWIIIGSGTLIILLLVICLVLVFGVREKNVFASSCEKIISLIDDNYDKLYSNAEQTRFTAKGNLNLNLDIKDEEMKQYLDKYNGMKVDYEVGTDIEKEIVKYALSLSDDEKELIGGILF